MGTAYGHASVQNLAQCVGTLPDAPDLVQETAQDWIRHGGGRDAHECLAQADLALGAYREAAQEYDSLASVAAADRGRESANGHSEKIAPRHLQNRRRVPGCLREMARPLKALLGRL